MNASGSQALVLAIERQVPGKLVIQHAGNETDIDATALEDRWRGRGSDEYIGRAMLVDRDDITDDMRCRAFGDQLADLTFGDQLAFICGDIIKILRFKIHGLHRNIGIKSQAAVIDRSATLLLATFPARLFTWRGRRLRVIPG